MILRPLSLRDVDTVTAIQKASPELAQWIRRDYERVAQGDMTGWVAEDNGIVAGFIVARKLADEMEILNFAVAPESRRRKIGSELLRTVFDWGRANQVRRAFLEVRASNIAAIAFYERHQFASVGRRANYYIAPMEDAIVLAARLD